jgi:serine/threonine protein kinase
MGEVYRARDTRLGRDVAIKFLKAELSTDPQALARFESEGRAVAALSHPNIIALYDVGREGDTVYAVTELLEGTTLRERLLGGPLPPRKTLEYVRAVAEAIAAAHSRGIVHRDLKPENVFVTNDGRVKVLDFGIAHMAAAPMTPAIDDAGETREKPKTSPGTMIGTIGYMAPEQVRGGATDPRTDVFALGALLYEALSGHAAFKRETPADTLSAILTAEPPDLPRISSSAGPAIEHIVRRCLEKAPEERFQSARDLSFALEALSAGTGGASGSAERPGSGSGSGPGSGRRNLRMIVIASGVAAAVVAGSFAAGRFTVKAPPSAPPALFSLSANTAPFDAVSVSPDGRYIAYTGAAAPTSAAGNTGVSLRRLDSLGFAPMSETSSAFRPFLWSPDSKTFGYFVDTTLIVREVPPFDESPSTSSGTGAPRALAQFPGRATGAAWGPNGVLLVSTAAGVFQVPAKGGTPQLVMKTDLAREIWRGWPSFLPGGDRFLDTTLRNNGSESTLETRAASLDGRELGTVLTGAVGAMYADGYLLFGMSGALYAQPFDSRSLTLSGERRQIAASVSQNWRSGEIAASASSTGVLVFRTAPQSEVQFTWVDRVGRKVGTVGAPDSYTNFDVSPDGRRIVATRRDPKTGVNSLTLTEVERGVTTPITPLDEDDFDDPTWAPDGRQIAYRRANSIVMRAANGGDESVIVTAEAFPDHFTRDGRFLTYGRQRLGFYEAQALDLLTPGAKPVILVPNVTLSDEARFSRNEKWVAYASNQSGADEIWVIPFPPTGEKWRISQAGGVQPRWSSDGNELFFLDPDGRLMAVSIPEGDPRRAGEPKPLFATGLTPSNALDQLAVVGDRFLLKLPLSSRAEDSSPIQVLVNWTTR